MTETGNRARKVSGTQGSFSHLFQMDGKDGHGLKREKVGPYFNDMRAKITKKVIVSAP